MNKVTQIKNKLSFTLLFGTLKFLIVIVPIWLADILNKSDYGIVEYSLIGLGMIITSLFGLGIPGAYPYFIIKKEKHSFKNAFFIHPIWLLFLLLLNQTFYYLFSLYDINIYFALNFTYLIANQQFYSSILKSEEKIIKAIFIDSGVYIILFTFIILTILGFIDANIETLNSFIKFYIGIYVFYGIFLFYKSNKNEIINKYYEIIKYSYHLIIASFLIFVITFLGTLLIKHFFSNELVAIYGFYFRLASIVVISQRIINIMFFKKLYSVNPNILDKYYALLFIFMFISAFVGYYLIPLIITHFSNFFNETFLEYKKIFLILIFQMVFWGASAMNSFIIDRERLVKKNNIKFILIIVICFIYLFFYRNKLDILGVVYLHFTLIFISILIQYLTLYSKNIFFKKSLISIIIIFIFSSLIIFLN